MRYLIVLLIILPCFSPIHAEVLGRFFFTPEERATLDKQRLENGLSIQQADSAPPMNSVTLNGHIKRSGGPSTVWLNGVPQREGDTPKRVKITDKKHAPEEVAVKLPDSNRTYPLKVGQTLTPGSGEIREGYQHPQRAASAPDTSSKAMPDGLNAALK